MKLNYNLLYQESIKNPAVKIQPLWIDYCRTAGVSIPGTIKTVSPTEPFHNLLNILGLSDEEKKDMQAACKENINCSLLSYRWPIYAVKDSKPQMNIS